MTDLKHWLLLGVVVLAMCALVQQASADDDPRTRREISWRPAPPDHSKDLLERVYMDDSVLAKPTSEEKARGLILYQRPYTELVFPNSVPAEAERVESLSVLAAPGEYEPITVAIYALDDLTAIDVEIADPALPEGSELPVDVRVAKCVFKRITHYTGPGEFMYMPTWLADWKKTDLPAGQSLWLWLDVHVPWDAKPGTYKGTFRILGKDVAELPIEVKVLPIALPREPHINVGFYDSPTAEKLAQQRKHGMTSVGWTGGSGAKLSLADHAVTVDLSGSAMETILDAYRKAGFQRPILWLMSGDVYKWCLGQAEVGSDRFRKLYGGAMRQIHDEAVRRGWAEIIAQPDDECPTHHDRMERSRIKLPLLKRARFRTEMDHYLAYFYDGGGSNGKWVEETLPFVDVITLRYWHERRLGQAPWREVVQRVSDLHKELWTYNITAAHTFPQPTSMRFSGGWFFRTLGRTCRGMYFWAYSSVQGDPYNDLDASCSDWLYYYPTDMQRGYSGGPSIDLVCLREGLDDLRYIEALERLIGLIEAKGDTAAARAARTTLGKLVNSFNFSEAHEREVEGTKSVWQVLEDRDGERVAHGWYRYPNGWSPARYDNARRAVAEQIVKLQEE